MKIKTILSTFFALCIVAVVAVLMTINTHSVKDPLLMENVEAFANQDPCSECGEEPCVCPGEKCPLCKRVTCICEGFYYIVSADCTPDEENGKPWVTYDDGACSVVKGIHTGSAYCWQPL